MRTVLLSLLLCASAHAADDPSDRAKVFYDEGIKRFDAGDYRKALTAFEQAYLILPEPVFLFNLAQCYKNLGDPVASLHEYRTYLKRAPQAENRREVEAYIAAAEREIERRGLPTEPGPLPPKPGEVKPVEVRPVEVKPATTAVKPAPKRSEGKAAEPPPPPVQLAPAPIEVAPPSVESKRPEGGERVRGPVGPTPIYRRWWLWTAVAAVAVIGASAVVLALTIANDAPVPETSAGYVFLSFH